MAEADPRRPDNLRIWKAVEKTNPAHTKKVNQRGGFTAISAHYQIKSATEQFGPLGEGWGYTSTDPILLDGIVTVGVTLWHGTRENRYGPVWGGADLKDSKGKLDSDAPKKAGTDGLTKALSQLGFNADVFMGRFDDNKYVAAMEREFAQQEREEAPAARTKLAGPYTSKTALWAAVKAFDREVRSCGDIDQLDALLETADTKALLEQCGRDAPQLLDTGEGLPAEFVPINKLIAMFRAELESQANQGWQNNPLNGG
jgi:hypothetical protein